MWLEGIRLSICCVWAVRWNGEKLHWNIKYRTIKRSEQLAMIQKDKSRVLSNQYKKNRKLSERSNEENRWRKYLSTRSRKSLFLCLYTFLYGLLEQQVFSREKFKYKPRWKKVACSVKSFSENQCLCSRLATFQHQLKHKTWETFYSEEKREQTPANKQESPLVLKIVPNGKKASIKN